MKSTQQSQNSLRPIISPITVAALATAMMFALIVFTSQAQAQTYKVLHTFTGGTDGTFPYAGLTLDKAGNLYGTTSQGGSPSGGPGTVFQLKLKNSSFVFNHLYSFTGSDGANPYARVIFGPNGTLYGTTNAGGAYGEGTVFNLTPSLAVCKTALCPWTETVLHSFGFDGLELPGYGDLIFDHAGNIYGTTEFAMFHYSYPGAVHELTPSGRGWTENGSYVFMMDGSDGAGPEAGVIMDQSGNLYGTTVVGGDLACQPPNGCGTVYQVTPSGSGWTENTLYSFSGGNGGVYPVAGLIFDPLGNLYGATETGGSGGGGTVFKLTPAGHGNWTYTLIYSFTGIASNNCGPQGTLVMDGLGSLYGTTARDGVNNAGSVFKLTPSDGNWTYTSLHDFTGGSDGYGPLCNVVFDARGNLYGTTAGGGAYFAGVVWEITP
jgi:uncharacterized repeat protein (TIGR03803 family)